MRPLAKAIPWHKNGDKKTLFGIKIAERIAAAVAHMGGSEPVNDDDRNYYT